MPITTEWDNEEKTIIHATFDGEFTWDEFEVMDRQAGALLDSVDHKVDIIADLETVVIPKDTLANFRRFAQMSAYTHPSAGLVVHVGTNRFTEIMVDLVKKVNKQFAQKMSTAATVEEAREVIAEYWRRRRV